MPGRLRVNQTLTANTDGITDPDGLTRPRYSYEWLVDDTVVPESVGRQYTVRQSDLGKRIKVRVDFTDDGGFDETLTSAATAAVQAELPPTETFGWISKAGCSSTTARAAGGARSAATVWIGAAGTRVAQVVCRQLGKTGGELLGRRRSCFPSEGGRGLLYERDEL